MYLIRHLFLFSALSRVSQLRVRDAVLLRVGVCRIQLSGWDGCEVQIRRTRSRRIGDNIGVIFPHRDRAST
ncbi:hypothetical protein DE146DRAFT_656787 [Phaeosphaeria sp. MPI-PUGE-AT-0046c]|nr:hypothetical protein DE146DRAFT_656787 [Phaeosphaeria sp. MPI-PUGE-AT-0046c]